MTAENSIIREGETPDPVYPLANIGGKFQLNAGKSQAFLIRLKSSESTPSGWYSAQLNITNSSGQVVKTATVFCYVWDFVIEEETALKTSFILSNDTTYGGTYKKFYDYLLENRLLAMDVPGALNSDNPYVTNPRVNAIRVTAGGIAGQPGNTYGDVNSTVSYSAYPDAYSELSCSDIWDDVKDKFYFYTADEPVGVAWKKWTKMDTFTVGELNSAYKVLENNWADAKSVVPFHENHPYPELTVSSPLTNYQDYELQDAIQGMIDGGGVSIWCPQFYAFTPQSELTAAGYNGTDTQAIRELSCSISGLYAWGDINGENGKDFFVGHNYYNWNNIYGEFEDRIDSEVYLANQNGTVANSELWAYSAGWNKTYTYCNHLIESTGLQTKMLFWQLYQNDVTGYLYYGTNNWTEYDYQNGTHVDNTVTGGNIMAQWKTNKHVYTNPGHAIYGNGMLFYGASQARIRGVADYVGTLRVELMRDGIEEYQMLTMLEDYLGEGAAKQVVGRVSTNVVRYLSLPGFSTSGWDSAMDEYDIMAQVRKDLGNSLEAAVDAGACDHKWNSGVITEEAGCVTAGTKTYTCTECGAVDYETVPTLHSVGDCYEKISGTAATCTVDGSEVYQCTLCGNRRTVTTTAFHNDRAYYSYEQNSAKAHTVYCTVCSEKITVEDHTFFTIDTATCTEAGQLMDECRYCGYMTVPTDDNGNEVITNTEAKGHKLISTTVPATCTENGYTGEKCANCDYEEVTVIESEGHTYVDGTCSVCGEKEPVVEPEYTPGDLTGDGTINAMDVNIAKRILSGAVTPSAAQNLAGDINGDGQFNGKDANYLARIASGAIG